MGQIIHDHNHQGILESLLTMKCFSNTFQQPVKLLPFTFEALARSQDISLRIHAPHLSTALYISTRIDNCNSLLVNLPACSLQKLQRVLNTAARIVSLRPKRDDIIPVLISLHWLPIEHRIHYKIMLLVFRCLHNLAPSYPSDLL